MNFSFFEILILLFIVWPFLKKLLEKNQPGNQSANKTPENQQKQAETEAWTEDPLDWDNAFQDLEELFTGKKTTVETKPEPEPSYTEDPYKHIDRGSEYSELVFERGSRQQEIDDTATRKSAAENPFHYDADDFLSGDEPGDIVDDDNPIFQDLDEETEVTVFEGNIGIDVTRDLKNKHIMRNAIVIKEVLDRPLSKRRTKKGDYSRSPIY